MARSIVPESSATVPLAAQKLSRQLQEARSGQEAQQIAYQAYLHGLQVVDQEQRYWQSAAQAPSQPVQCDATPPTTVTGQRSQAQDAGAVIAEAQVGDPSQAAVEGEDVRYMTGDVPGETETWADEFGEVAFRWFLAGMTALVAVVDLTHPFLAGATAGGGKFGWAHGMLTWPAPFAQPALASAAAILLYVIGLQDSDWRSVDHRQGYGPLLAAALAGTLGAGPMILVCVLITVGYILIGVILAVIMIAVIAILM